MTKRERRTFPFGPDLYLIDLPQSAPGFQRFISSWFFRDAAGRRVVVDPGPASTIPLLLRELEGITDGVDLVLLTHIHLDHSGGIVPFCARFPAASVLAHPRAFRHLREPRKLWDASVRTLGDVALMYGEPTPLPSSVALLEEDPAGRIEVFQTPGHAPHHLCFHVPGAERTFFFVGEAAGMILPLGDGGLWLRPATPHRFDADAARRSLALISSVLRGDELLCYAHWGAVEAPKERVAQAEEQLDVWLKTIASMKDSAPEEIVEYLLAHDRLLRPGHNGPVSLPDGLLERERQFMENSVLGFLGFLKERES
ncbi:MAG: MBL fold metallo-hydrolase [Fretibacterium sp.]|nr:MBL fold metallo-hydrolase [Fretibacterium sp.]